jgi:transcription initiation factor TFIIIB Brf1 subunit/transcription initiation factor TFIIB
MKICPKCHAEVPDLDWNCPKCGYHFESSATIAGHATSGKEEKDSRFQVSGEDTSMIRDKNHSTSEDSGDEMGYEADQPYSSMHHYDDN